VCVYVCVCVCVWVWVCVCVCVCVGVCVCVRSTKCTIQNFLFSNYEDYCLSNVTPCGTVQVTSLKTATFNELLDGHHPSKNMVKIFQTETLLLTLT